MSSTSISSLLIVKKIQQLISIRAGVYFANADELFLASIQPDKQVY